MLGRFLTRVGLFVLVSFAPLSYSAEEDDFEPVDLPPAEAAAAMEHQELLARLGVSIEPFGGDTLLISSYPAMLSSVGVFIHPPL